MRIRRAGLVPAALAVVAVLVVLTSAGCGGPDDDGRGQDRAEDVATPDGLSVSVLQYRSDYAARRIEIKVTNAGRAPVIVTGAALSSTAFTGEAHWQSRNQADETSISPGTSTDLPAPLTPSRCPGAGVRSDPAGFRTTVRLDLRLADGSTGRTAALPVRDPFTSITQVHTEDCRRAGALAVADLALVDPLRTERRGGVLVGLLDLRLTPTGKPGTLVLESIGSTTLLSPPRGDTWTIGRTVDGGTGPQTVTLELRASRCDPHAIAEDKLGTVLPLMLRVDGGESGIVTVPADPSLRRQIQSFVHDACAPS